MRRPRNCIRAISCAAVACVTACTDSQAAGERAPQTTKTVYDPLAVTAHSTVEQLEFDVRDQRRERTIPLRIYLPRADAAAPVVLFSHGLGGTRNGCAYLGNHWAARGYVAVFLQHPGSDDSVWRDVEPNDRLRAMQRAASGSNLRLRVQDVSAVLDQLETWHRSDGHVLSERLDLKRVGMSGHSFGAVTTQAVSGQGFLQGRTIFTDDRIRAAIAFSPSSPRRGKPSAAFSSVRIPWMLMTGTLDTAPIGDADLTSRLEVFPHLPPGDKYELVLHEAEHSAFTDRRLPGDRMKRNPNHHRVILALSTAFWDAYLKRDQAAKLWLQSEGPRTLLQPHDRWQTK